MAPNVGRALTTGQGASLTGACGMSYTPMSALRQQKKSCAQEAGQEQQKVIRRAVHARASALSREKE